eukprot:726940-Hanusia_phi.AAC.1
MACQDSDTAGASGPGLRVRLGEPGAAGPGAATAGPGPGVPGHRDRGRTEPVRVTQPRTGSGERPRRCAAAALTGSVPKFRANPDLNFVPYCTVR